MTIGWWKPTYWQVDLTSLQSDMQFCWAVPFWLLQAATHWA